MKTKRMQVLVEPEEYERLEELARRRGTSVAELIRAAVRRCYFPASDERRAAVEDILTMRVPVDDWDEIEGEISEGRDGTDEG